MKKTKLDIKAVSKYLLNKNGKEENEMLNRRISNDEEGRKEFEAYLKVWENSADLKELEKVNVDEDWNKVRSRMSFLPRRKRIPLRKYGLRIAAILILALGLAYFLTQVLNKTELTNPEYYEIASASEIREIELPDGSIVSLNNYGKLFRSSDFGKSNRDIILEGEAFFNVSKNKDMPFKIHTMNSTVEVLGTSFNVKSDTDLIVVSVMAGKVAFYLNEDSDARLELNPDNAGELNNKTRKLELQESFDPNTLTWYTKEFVFRNKPLIEVCNHIADYYHLKLIMADELQNDESISITCSTESVHEVLNAINLSFYNKNVELIATKKNLIVRKK
jgi:ferric-dicitrate binding protein FerR (iron transport regulator)